jgi:hypothetical protein
LQEKDDIISRMDKQHAELMAKYDSLLEKHDTLIGYARDTKDELAHLTDVVEDHNDALPEKLTDVLRPLTNKLVKSPVENALKGRFVVLSLGRRQYRIARGQNRNVTRVVSENPDATVILDLPLVGAQDRMTEVRRRVRQNITDGLLGRSSFRASLVSNLEADFVTLFLRSILDVHEEFESIPLDVIAEARQQLSI